MVRARGANPGFYGLMNKSNHVLCRRCGNHSFHKSHKECAKCGFGISARLKKSAVLTKKGFKHAVRKFKKWIPSQGKNRYNY